MRSHLFVLVAGLIAQVVDAAPVDFHREIKPLLDRHCMACHSHKKSESGLRLDLRGSALKGGDSGHPAVTPGDRAKSALWLRVTAPKDDDAMPPDGRRLSRAERELLGRWIDEQAPWPEEVASSKPLHWAFVAPARPSVPASALGGDKKDWGRNAIDRFIAQRLATEKMSPSSSVDRTTYLRRLSLDLVGLPPKPEEVDAFLADKSPNAEKEVVERLLASPHFGERWGRLWLDAARYADSNGYEKDRKRETWVYRDWVVDALNRDLPYDQFIIQQVAGDQLPGARQDQIVATGFLRNSMLNEEGGVDPEQFRMDAMFDRMDALGKSVLGLTIQCAQCHTHKFDPLTQEEYYRLFAFLNGDHEARPAVYSSADQITIDRLRERIARIDADRREKSAGWKARFDDWARAIVEEEAEWKSVRPTECIDLGGGAKYDVLADDSVLAGGWAPGSMTTRFTAPLSIARGGSLRLDVLTDPNLPLDGPGRSENGDFALTELSAEIVPPDGKPIKAKLVAAQVDLQSDERPVRSNDKRTIGPVQWAVDNNVGTAWGPPVGHGKKHADRTAVFNFEKPLEIPKGSVLVLQLSQQHGAVNPETDQNNMVGRFRVSVRESAIKKTDRLATRSTREILSRPPNRRSPSEEDALIAAWRRQDPPSKPYQDQIDKLLSEWPTPVAALALKARDLPRKTMLLKRGDWLKPSREVTPGVPAFLHPLPEGAPLTRLTFARWLVDRKSPTAARVIVNRIWQAYFGEGLLATPEDFGSQSPPPSHPELLDWLACELMDNNWSLKHIHRLIVDSATYRQSSRVSPSNRERDPGNRLLARGPRVRVDAEVVRDIALASSGLLSPAVGGPSVFPPAPAFLFKPPASYEAFAWKEDEGPQRYRRSIYTFRRRSTPYPALAAFDAPNGDFSCVRRARSNTPIQALVGMNEPLFVEASRALALKSIVEAGPAPRERATFIFRRVLGRRPGEDELQDLMRLYDLASQRFAEGWIDPKLLVTERDLPKPLSDKGTPTQWAATTLLARVVLNLDEAVTKE